MKKKLIFLLTILTISFNKTDATSFKKLGWGAVTLLSGLATLQSFDTKFDYLNIDLKNIIKGQNLACKLWDFRQLILDLRMTGLCALATKYCYDKYKEN